MSSTIINEWLDYLRSQHVAVVDFKKAVPYLRGGKESDIASLIAEFPELKEFLRGMKEGLVIPPEVARNLPDEACWNLIGRWVYAHGIFYDIPVELSFMGMFLNTIQSRTDTVLDIGCGTGHRLNFLSSRGVVSGRCIGVDRDPFLIKKAMAGAEREGARVEYRVGDCCSLPLPNKSVDYAYAFYLLSWVDNWRKAILEACRVLKAGGILYINNCSTSCRNPIGQGLVAQYLQELYFDVIDAVAPEGEGVTVGIKR